MTGLLGNAIIRERLRRMKEILLNDGWTKGQLVQFDEHRRPSGYCLLGAAERATGVRDEQGQIVLDPKAKIAMFAVSQELEATINDGRKRHVDVPGWNDRKMTTLPMVMKMLDKTILRLTPRKQRVKTPARTRSTVKL